MRIRPRHRAHTLTTASTGALYPCQAEPGLGGRGVYVGRDVSGGGAFCFDAWEAYDAGHITGRGTILAGALGKRKSSLTKSLIYRSVPFGRQAWVVDVKGEYERLCAAVGGSFISLEPGGSVRLNPLETRFGDPQRPRHRIRADQLDLLSSIVEASFRQADRVLRPEEHTAIEVALDEATAQAGGQPTLHDMVQVLLHPTAEMAVAACADRPTLEAWSRDIGHQLRRLVTGDLGGMFDGHTSGTIDLSAPVVAFDVHRMQSSDALPILMTCAMSWLTAALARRDGTRRMLVLDEAWKLMERPGLLRYWQAAWKLPAALRYQPGRPGSRVSRRCLHRVRNRCRRTARRATTTASSLEVTRPTDSSPSGRRLPPPKPTISDSLGNRRGRAFRPSSSSIRSLASYTRPRTVLAMEHRC